MTRHSSVLNIVVKEAANAKNNMVNLNNAYDDVVRASNRLTVSFPPAGDIMNDLIARQHENVGKWKSEMEVKIALYSQLEKFLARVHPFMTIAVENPEWLVSKLSDDIGLVRRLLLHLSGKKEPIYVIATVFDALHLDVTAYLCDMITVSGKVSATLCFLANTESSDWALDGMIIKVNTGSALENHIYGTKGSPNYDGTTLFRVDTFSALLKYGFEAALFPTLKEFLVANKGKNDGYYCGLNDDSEACITLDMLIYRAPVDDTEDEKATFPSKKIKMANDNEKN